ncbi:MAG: winged helix-turn-helix domain-containing protein, partial [Hansschlegelia sp.]
MDGAAFDKDAGDITFGPFRLAIGERLLTRDGATVEIGGRALDLLIALVEQPGRVLSKRDLLKRVWPDVIAEDGSLRFHVASLRRLLGDGENGARYVATHVGVGYAFVGQADRLQTVPVPREPSAAAPAVRQGRSRSGAPGDLPPRSHVIGRQADLDLIEQRLQKTRLFTLVGAGGVGKTSLAVEYAHRAASGSQDARFVDLAAIDDPALVATAIATALGISVQGEEAMPVLMAHIRDRDCLIVLDNCEHL